MTPFEKVVWDARTQMMNVMKSNIARKPLEDFRQFIERASLERHSPVVPLPGAGPISPLELMLNIEQPYAGGTCECRDSELDQQKGLEADHAAHDDRDRQQCPVRAPHRVALSLRTRGRRK